MKAKIKGKIRINRELCKGCGYCIYACPNQCIVLDNSINSKGYIPVVFLGKDSCTGCTSCAIICPDIAITVWR
ncbi:MAG: 4Fe-4S binding protein [Thermodesulfovibrionales bacterium]|nr:4Fe-4S binding protein [Thermodesulfovibrionales bacterium]